jgi:hypothetical protein
MGLTRRQMVPKRTPQRADQRLKTVPAPFLGLNSTDALSEMALTDALEMDNIISAEVGLAVREGYYAHAANVGGNSPVRPIGTVMAYAGAPANSIANPATTLKIFAATDFGIYDVTTPGDKVAVAALMALSGTTGAGRMSIVQATTGGTLQYLVACSETDGGYLYDGATWIKMTNIGGPGPGIITGCDPTLFVQVVQWKRRLMFVERASTRVWILPIDSVGGAAQLFDFGAQLRNGGALLGLINWTQDDGVGVDDRLVVFGSAGDVAIYEGTDPTNAATFGTVGTWFVGAPPVGRRCFTSVGGNPYLLTTFGIIPVALLVQGGLDNILTSDTQLLKQLRKIQQTINIDFQTALNSVGWEMLMVSSKALLVVARPPTDGGELIQYAFHLHNNAWCRFVGIPATTWARVLSDVYGGTSDGRVLRLLSGYTDGADIAGAGATEITSRVTPAFNYLDNPAVQKQMLMIKPTFLGQQEPAWGVAMNVDFEVTANPTIPAPPVPAGALWNSALWDSATWGGANTTQGSWRSVSGLGFTMAPTVLMKTTTQTVLTGYQYMFKQGGPF